MTFGQKKLMDIFNKVAEQGGTISPEQEIELRAMADEIDALYETILKNQENFGVPMIFIDSEDKE